MTRLSDPLKEAERLEPWSRATAIDDLFLYWMPVSGFPMTADEKLWLTEFLRLWELKVAAPAKLRPEIFVHMRALSKDAADDFLRYAQKCIVRLGLGRRPAADIPRFPTAEQIKKIAERGETIDLYEWTGDYHYWFVNKDPARQRELFLGHGGMMTLYLPPDPKIPQNKLPFTPKLREAFAVFKQVDVDAMIEGSNAAMDSFLPESKRLFGKGLEDRPQYPGIPFVLPALDSGHILAATAEQRREWFAFAPMYVRESLQDKGVLLAFQADHEDALKDLLDEMRSRGVHYPTDRATYAYRRGASA